MILKSLCLGGNFDIGEEPIIFNEYRTPRKKWLAYVYISMLKPYFGWGLFFSCAFRGDLCAYGHRNNKLYYINIKYTVQHFMYIIIIFALLKHVKHIWAILWACGQYNHMCLFGLTSLWSTQARLSKELMVLQ